MRGQAADEFRQTRPFDIEQRAAEQTRPLELSATDRLIKMCGTEITVTFEMFGPPGDAFGAMKQPDGSDLLGIRFLGLRAVGDPEEACGQLPTIELEQD